MFDFFEERIKFGIFPTPIEKLEKLSAELGVNLFLKRDDLDEFIGSGNKVRKLEYLLYDAKKRGCDTILTAGGMQSNHCRATVYFARKISMNVELFLFGESKIQGNLLLDKLLGANVHAITKEEYDDIQSVMEKRARELSAKGHKAYLIPPGGSNALGLLGYAYGVGEISEWEKDNVKFDYVICATGTGGTLGGLELGRQIYRSNFVSLGINVTKKNASEIEEKMRKMFSDFNDRFSTSFEIHSASVIDGYVGEDYAVAGKEDFQVIKELAMKEQVIFDPVYTAKAFKGMKDLIKNGKIEKGSNVLFIHTGGTFGIFAFATQLEKILEE